MRPWVQPIGIAAFAAGIAVPAVGDGTVRFVGGSYDGHAQAEWQPTVLTDLAHRFRGGAYDGHALDGWIQTSVKELASRFQGGFHDGHDRARWTPTVLPSLAIRFRGGDRDGHDRLGVSIFRFEIVSAHGVAAPPPGMYVHSFGACLTNTVTAEEVLGTTQYVAHGWSMSGHEPLSGETLTCVFTMTNDAVLTWLWRTNYWLATAASSHGQVLPSPGWQAAGSNVLVLSIPDPYCHLVRWSGDVPPDEETNTTLLLRMDTPKAVTAWFAETLAALGTPHWWLALHHLTNGGLSFDEAEALDPDGDGHRSWQEWVAETDPTNAASCLQILDLSVGVPLTVFFQSSSNRLYTLRSCQNVQLGDWTNVAGAGPRRGTGGPDSMADPHPQATPRFYRLTVELP